MASNIKIQQGTSVQGRKRDLLERAIGYAELGTISHRDSSTDKTSSKKVKLKELDNRIENNKAADNKDASPETGADKSSSSKASSIDDMLDIGRKYLDSPYLSPTKVLALGEAKAARIAKSSSASGLEPIDCSGFAQKVLASAGIDPPGDQDAEGLYNRFKRSGTVLSAPQKGALVFFEPINKEPANTGKWNSGKTITHVAFWSGNGKILDSSFGGGGVKERPFPNDKAYTYHYIMPKYKFGSGVS